MEDSTVGVLGVVAADLRAVGPSESIRCVILSQFSWYLCVQSQLNSVSGLNLFPACV